MHAVDLFTRRIALQAMRHESKALRRFRDGGIR